MPVNKAELIDTLVVRLGTDRRTATDVVEHLIDTIVRTVHRGESVTITGFGVFEKRRRASRVARNPRTGETIRVHETHVPVFRAGEQFKSVVSGKARLSAGALAAKRGAVPAFDSDDFDAEAFEESVLSEAMRCDDDGSSVDAALGGDTGLGGEVMADGDVLRDLGPATHDFVSPMAAERIAAKRRVSAGERAD